MKEETSTLDELLQELQKACDDGDLDRIETIQSRIYDLKEKS